MKMTIFPVIDANLQNNSQDVEAVTHVHKQRRRLPFFPFYYFFVSLLIYVWRSRCAVCMCVLVCAAAFCRCCR